MTTQDIGTHLQAAGSPMFKRHRISGDSGSLEPNRDYEESFNGTPCQSRTADSSGVCHDVGMSAGAHSLWKDQLLFDYTIEVEDKQFKVHKVIMATVSDFFKVMLTGGMMESQTDSVRLEGLTSLAVSNIIEFVYTGQFGSTRASPEELLACAAYLQIPAAVRVCTDLILDKVNKQNCLDILTFFKTHSLKHGITAMTDYISQNSDTILNACKPEDLSRDHFLMLMECCGKSEWVLFLGVKEWIDVDSVNRQQHLNDLMSHVRFALMTPQQLRTIKEMTVFCETDAGWQDLVDKALTYHTLPAHQKVVYNSEQNTVRGEPKMVVFSSDENDYCRLYSLLRYTSYTQERWREQELNGTSFKSRIDTAININNFLIVSDVSNDTQKLHIFDPRTMNWTLMGSMVKPRSIAAFAYSEKHLYALGGRLLNENNENTDSIEKYDFENNTWTVEPSQLPATSENLGAAVISDTIYVIPHNSCFIVIGDQQPHPRTPRVLLTLPRGQRLRYTNKQKEEVRMDCYNPVTHTWSAKAPLVETAYSRYNSVQVMELWNVEVLFVMHEGFKIHYYSPANDQWSLFNMLPSVDTDILSFRWSQGKVLTHGNSLFLFNVPYQKELKGACAKWTIRDKGQRIIEERLDDFEIINDEIYRDKKQYYPALLSMM